MEYVIGSRASGKTYKLIKIAAEHDLTMVVLNTTMIKIVDDMSRRMNLWPHGVLTHAEFIAEYQWRGHKVKGFVIDDVHEQVGSLERKVLQCRAAYYENIVAVSINVPFTKQERENIINNPIRR